ncbi:MAG: hydantoinase B/oxoprolinase family protein, partial [Alphaproteobacteria bacterium]|nr:hydantoinase B/oxoprolinase family protein [Alphaproteobacteria bacterium]
LRIDLPEMVYSRVIEADERVTAEGDVLRPLDEDALRLALREVREQGIAACAIVFLHGYRYPVHEKRAAEIARQVGFTQVSTSHQTVPLMKFVSRGDTTVADAYLSPVLSRYADRVSRALGGTRLYFITSNGGLAAPEFFRGKDAIASGPAGGVIAMAETAREAGFERVIGFDMGGTSTDAARFDGAYERIYETEVAGVRLRVPMLALNTVAAGGGSILHYDRARFRVGPDSAGADPGPKCYRRGGPLSVTDANVMVGKLRPEYFPHIFGPNADQPLDDASVCKAFTALATEIGDGRSPEEVADGFIRIAVENMANAIKRISVAKGYDVRHYTLNCFGGAGGQHACAVADALGISRIFIHPFSGVLSAYGMKLARLRSLRQKAVGQELTPALMSLLEATASELSCEVQADVLAQGGDAAQSWTRAHIRYEGGDTTLPIALTSFSEMSCAFAEAHARLFGFGFEGKRLIVESVEVEAESASTPPFSPATRGASAGTASPTTAEAENHTSDVSLPPSWGKVDGAATQQRSGPEGGASVARFFSQGARHEGVVHQTEELANGATVDGPALLIEPHQTIVVERGWRAEITEARAVVLTRTAERKALSASTDADPVLLEVFANLFMAIAEEMGATLQNTASSVNIKERLDFSCAIFDAEGGLVANAPHMPVHLGSMGD